MSATPSLDVVLLWHHHQPDYRRPEDGRAVLPWVRLHATKDYLDMAHHLERHPGVRATFNFVPVLLDQLEGAASGDRDDLFVSLSQPVETLQARDRVALARRLVQAPRHAIERWPLYRRLIETVTRAFQDRDPAERSAPEQSISDPDLLALEIWFLLAWLDPILHGVTEAAQVIERAGAFTIEHRDALLALHARLLSEVIPSYLALAARGQVELSASPYYHPILPLVVDLRVARRARPDLALPAEPFAAPDDARRQIERAIGRHAAIFGAPPAGLWPSEGSVSPEVAELAAGCGIRWLASDEGVLWASLPASERRRQALYRPWSLSTPAGEMALFFRDHELSDRIGFVYQRWDAAEAVRDFLQRLRRIARDHAGEHPPLVPIILDGENCWEGYPDDGASFLDQLYAALESAPDIRTRTPSEVLAEGPPPGRLERLHSGSWIDADFHIWIGHPEKNRAWDLVGRTRRALVAAGTSPETHAGAWESLFRAEGSDWFWWLGEDHFTGDRALFDDLFRGHLRAAYAHAGLDPPASLEVPIGRRRAPHEIHLPPIGFVRPILDGSRSHFYEWYTAGRISLSAGGGAMHRGAGMGRELYYGFDAERIFLRVDFVETGPPEPQIDLRIELIEPHAAALEVRGVTRGEHVVKRAAGREEPRELPGARCRVDAILELAIPFRSLGLAPGDQVELLAQAMRGGRPVETWPPDDVVRFTVPDETFEATMWSA